MRVTTAFKRLLRLDGVNVTAVEFLTATVVVTVALRRRRLICPHCGHKTRARYDTRRVESRWRHLDLGVWRVELRATLRRLVCPSHGVVVEAVPFARPGAHLTRDFDDLLAWLATRMDKTSTARLCRVSWPTVGRACERVVASELDPGRLDGLFRIGVDEISWRKHHFSGVPDLSRGVPRKRCSGACCHTLCVPCATCVSVSDIGDPRAGVACRADRHARVLDGGRQRLASGPGR